MHHHARPMLLASARYISWWGSQPSSEVVLLSGLRIYFFVGDGVKVLICFVISSLDQRPGVNIWSD